MTSLVELGILCWAPPFILVLTLKLILSFISGICLIQFLQNPSWQQLTFEISCFEFSFEYFLTPFLPSTVNLQLLPGFLK